jgi:hypothetical protein
MKHWMLVLILAALLGGCSSAKHERRMAQSAPKKVEQPQLVDANGVPIERVPFRAGVSSVTVENMAKAEGCVGGQGAGLVTEPGPVEVYRMMCDDGKVFRARCELRQCKRM